MAHTCCWRLLCLVINHHFHEDVTVPTMDKSAMISVAVSQILNSLVQISLIVNAIDNAAGIRIKYLYWNSNSSTIPNNALVLPST